MKFDMKYSIKIYDWLAKDFDIRENELWIMIGLIVIMEIVVFLEGDMFDYRLHWIPELMVFLLAGRGCATKKQILKLLLLTFAFVITEKLLLFQYLSIHFYQIFILASLCMLIGYYSHRLKVNIK